MATQTIIVPDDYASIQNAITVAEGGFAPDTAVTIRVRAGTYAEGLFFSQPWNWSTPLIVESYTGLSDVILDISNAGNEPLEFAVSGVILRNFRAVCSPPSQDMWGAYIRYGPILLENVEIRGTKYGFVSESCDGGLRLVNCRAVDTVQEGFYFTAGGPSFSMLQGCVALRCGLGGSSGFRWNSLGDGEGVILEACAAIACGGYGFVFGDTSDQYAAASRRLSHCVAAFNAYSGLKIDGYQDEKQLFLLNNIFRSNGEYAIEMTAGGAPADGSVAKWWNSELVRVVLRSDGNCFSNNTLGLLHVQNRDSLEEDIFTTLAQLRSYTAEDVHSNELNPLFLSETPGSEDVHLQSTSPLVNAGVGAGVKTDAFGMDFPDINHPAIGCDSSRDTEKDRGWPYRHQVEKNVAYGPRLLTKGTLAIYGTPIYVNLTSKVLWLRLENGETRRFAPGSYTMDAWFEQYVGQGKLTRLRV
jgi:hypothetical protein